MNTFLQDVLLQLQKKSYPISDLVFVVPSKRAGLFLKKELVHLYANQTFFIPEILSIEEFIEKLSGLETIDTIQTLFEFYDTYLETHTHLEKESLETFSSWAQILIHDFNEIDRYCIDHQDFFSYLSSIQDLNHWYLQKEKTTLVQNYIQFWEHLHEYYTAFKTRLLAQRLGYQGLLYRQASEKIASYCTEVTKTHVFLGFNALNTAEQIIFQTLLQAQKALVFWDTDQFFFKQHYHEAASFLRTYQKEWDYYKNQPFQWIQDYFSSEKEIEMVGVPRHVGQAEYVGTLLQDIPQQELEKTALVLADESLLLPMLNALPESIGALNITMGLPLADVPLATFFELLFTLHKTPSHKGFYYQQLIEILSTPPAQWLLGTIASEIIYWMSSENLVYLTVEKLKERFPSAVSNIDVLFTSWKDASDALQRLQSITLLCKANLDSDQHPLELEYVYHFYTLFNKLVALCDQRSYVYTIPVLHRMYKEVISTDALDFRGEPFQGLQLMGMLESRCLDFDTVIITSVNEGILPAGKSMNSFIPYDLKRAYSLPTYREKDAIYTYHFYRLIQRAKRVYLVYNTENDGVGGGEKSRLLYQLEIDKRPQHKITQRVATTPVTVTATKPLIIQKNEAIHEQLKALVAHGLSPSALAMYIRNPIDFYYQYVLKINAVAEVEETIAANTLGTVIHNTLETFYKPLEGQYLTLKHLEAMETQIEKEVKHQFRVVYAKMDLTQGKNALAFEVSKRYLHNFLRSEKQLIANEKPLKIIGIERTLKTEIKVPTLDFPIYIKGKVDRVDELDGQLRVIDYKTGKVLKNDVVLMDWDTLTEDYKYSKSLQVLAYAYMYREEISSTTPFEAGIISFKNLNAGFLKFGTKQSARGAIQHEVNTEVFEAYLTQLQQLILEIFNPELPFEEKEV